MHPRLQRASLLLQQRRYELAAREARAALGENPQQPEGHALLALCLAGSEQLEEATEAAGRAIALAPGLPFAHYVMGAVLLERERYGDAERAAAEAVRLDPTDADHFGLLGQVRLGQERWAEALEEAERGLALDPQDPRCVNLRGLALLQLGRKDEAAQVLEQALRSDPERATTHASRGWVLLDRGEPAQALEAFREALRLDPELEHARRGMVYALKARYRLYGLCLRYFLWMSKLGQGRQWIIIIAGVVGANVLVSAAREHPGLAPVAWTLLGLYLAFLFLTWTANPLFNLALRLNRFGRLSLFPEQRRCSNWVGLSLAVGVLGLLLWGLSGRFVGLATALMAALMIIPIAGTYSCREGWPRIVMGGVSLGLACIGLSALALLALSGSLPPDSGAAPLVSAELISRLFQLFFWGAILSTWATNLLGFARPKR